MAIRLSALKAGRALLSRNSFMLLVLISVRGSVNPKVIARLEGLGTLKKFNDVIGTRTRKPSGLKFRWILEKWNNVVWAGLI
jgi:hypothetical protein